ncbi:MAG: thiamine pyrophosphate-binding protein [Lentisphaeria bacterium]|nr:thiamine pyrophosphate-binding protein [Lentisphaeria bacterium]
MEKIFASGNEAVARAAFDCGVSRGVGYPGTPSTEILENFSLLGGTAEWAPNEKVALEVGIGVALAHGRSLVTMKHVGLNVAADPLFTIAYSGTPGGLVIVSADDPGLASSQNEQDNRNYAAAAGIPMLEPADTQEAYDFTRRAFELSETYRTPVLLRMTTRVCHSKCIMATREKTAAPAVNYVKDVQSNVMVPAFAKLAHRRLRARLAEIARINDEEGEFIKETAGSADLGIIATGISAMHAREAAPEASFLQIGLTYPLPMERIRKFAASVKRCVVVEEGDPILYTACRAAGIPVDGKDEMFRFGELTVGRIRRLLAGDLTPEPAPPAGKPPQLCVGCPHRKTYETLRDLNCIVSGDIGCYTLGVMPPFSAVDSCVCMGASINVGLGLRHTLPEAEARRVVSVIGDSTFLHTGINGIVEMVYNRPATGHVVLILDNSITAMTGLQENPSTGRKLDHTPAPKVIIEDVVKAIGVDHVDIIDTTAEQDRFAELLKERLAGNDLSVIICRRPCILGMVKAKQYELANAAGKGE